MPPEPSPAEPSQWERTFLANVAIPAEEWARRQRRVRGVGIAVGTLVTLLVLLSLLASAGAFGLLQVALVVLGAGCLVLLRNLHRWMGVMRGAAEHHARKAE